MPHLSFNYYKMWVYFKIMWKIRFFFQRLHRCINSAVLVSAQESAKEMLGIVKKGDFSRLFMKSTIRVCLLSSNKFGYFLLLFDDIHLLTMHLVQFLFV